MKGFYKKISLLIILSLAFIAAPSYSETKLVESYVVIVGGGTSESALHPLEAKFTSSGLSRLVSLPNNSILTFESKNISGLNPGFHIAVLGFCTQKERAESLRDVANQTFPGSYIKKVHVDSSRIICPSIKKDDATKSENAMCGCGGDMMTVDDLSPDAVYLDGKMGKQFHDQVQYANQWLVLRAADESDAEASEDVILANNFSGLHFRSKRLKVLGSYSPFDKDDAERARKEHRTNLPVVYSGAYSNNTEAFKKKIPDDLYFSYVFSSDLGVQVRIRRSEEVDIRTACEACLDTESVQAIQVITYNPRTMVTLDTYQRNIEYVPDFKLAQLCGGDRLLYMGVPSSVTPFSGFVDSIAIVINPLGDIVYDKYLGSKWYVNTNRIARAECKDFAYLELFDDYRERFREEKNLIWNGNDFIELIEK